MDLIALLKSQQILLLQQKKQHLKNQLKLRQNQKLEAEDLIR